MGKYLDVGDLINALNPATVRACLDDDGDGDPDSAPTDDVIDRAEAHVDSHLVGVINIAKLNNSDRMLEAAALEYAIAYTLERHPEFSKGWSKDTYDRRLKSAMGIMGRLQSAAMRLPDQTDAAAKPKNVGGLVLKSNSRMISDDPFDRSGGTNNGMF